MLNNVVYSVPLNCTLKPVKRVNFKCVFYHSFFFLKDILKFWLGEHRAENQTARAEVGGTIS